MSGELGGGDARRVGAEENLQQREVAQLGKLRGRLCAHCSNVRATRVRS